jgi:Zn-dependent protease
MSMSEPDMPRTYTEPVAQTPTEWLPPVAPDPPVAADPPPPANEQAHEAFGEKTRKRGGGIIAAIAVMAAKGKALLLLRPKIKLLTTSGSMLVSIAAYAVIWGWQFAVGFVLLLFIHEMGHVIQLRREGIEASAPLFIPFLGAVVWAKKLGDDALAEARVGLAGPILGSIGAALCLPIYAATGNNLFLALAFTGFFLNLFNLIPVVPLDGGRAMAAMAPAMWFFGLAVMVAAAFVFPNPIILIFLLFGVLETWKRWKALRRGDPKTQAYYRVSRRDRALVAAVYLGLIGALVVGMDATHLVRHVN